MNDRMNPAIAIIRLLVGWVFFVEGTLKFLLANELGAGRFTASAFPHPVCWLPSLEQWRLVAGRW